MNDYEAGVVHIPYITFNVGEPYRECFCYNGRNKKLSIDYKFCPYCGNKLHVTAQQMKTIKTKDDGEIMKTIFKIGNKVTIIGNCVGHPYLIGEIVNINRYIYPYLWECVNAEGRFACVHEDDMKIIKK